MLAIVYGLATLAAFFVGYLVMMAYMFLTFIPMTFNMEMSAPVALAASGSNLFLAEKSLKADFKKDFWEGGKGRPAESYRVLQWDGKQWRPGPLFQQKLSFLSVVNGRLAGAGGDDVFLFDGLTPAAPVSMAPEIKSIAPVNGGLAVLYGVSSRALRLAYLGADLSVVKDGEPGLPQCSGSACGCDYKLAGAGDRLLAVWYDRGLKALKYSEIKDGEAGGAEELHLNQEQWSVFAGPDRILLLANSFHDPKERGWNSELGLWEWGGEQWKNLSTVKLPFMATIDTHAVEYRGHVLLCGEGFSETWREFDGREWKDVSQELGRAGAGPFGGMMQQYRRMGRGMMLLTWAFYFFPLLVVAAAHYHFRRVKYPYIFAGGRQVELASFGRRFIAFAIDWAICSAPFMTASFLLMDKQFEYMEAMFTDPGKFALYLTVMMGLTLCFLLVPLLYFFLQERKWGRTLGKKLMGLRVIMEQGEPLTGMGAFLRNLVRLPEMIILYIPVIICVAATIKYQRLGDLAGKTIVIRESGAAPPAPPWPPLPGP
jgi:uncharacterized RDD family membrane protein YckC